MVTIKLQENRDYGKSYFGSFPYFFAYENFTLRQLDETTYNALVEDARKGNTVKDIYKELELVNLEPGGGGGRLTDKSYLNTDEAINIAGHLVEKNTAVAWAYMLMDARWAGFDDEIFTIVSSYRTYEQQKELWDAKFIEVKTAHPDWKLEDIIYETNVYVANPEDGFPHGTGRALDLRLSIPGTDKESIDKKKQTPDFIWLSDNAAKYGFYNYEPEPWHWEYNP